MSPIAIFDSGLGGLTVFREIARLLPHEALVYLGDTARLPYGTKSPETIVRYTTECADFLLRKGIKLLVIACHTASSHALLSLQKALPIPVLGMIQPGVDLILERGFDAVAILGTEATLASGAYQNLLFQARPNGQLFPIACPLFVPLVEEGLQSHSISLQAARHYLGPLAETPIQAALLACTHYPLLAPAIQQILGPAVELLEPARRCAQNVKRVLHDLNLLETSSMPKTAQFYTTDAPGRFAALAERFLGMPISTRINQLELNKNLNYS